AANLTVALTAQSGSQLLAQSGTINVGNAVTATGATFSASSGATLNFNSDHTRTFDASSTVSGAGTVQWASATNTLSGTYHDTRPISNAGTLNYTGGYYSYFYNGATLTNSGTIDFQGDGGFYIGSGTSNSVINNGIIKKSAGTSNGSIQVALLAQSGSQIQIQ